MCLLSCGPSSAKWYFDKIDSNRGQLKDVPMTTVMPVLEELKELLGQKDVGADNWGEGGGSSGGELAALQQSWSELALN